MKAQSDTENLPKGCTVKAVLALVLLAALVIGGYLLWEHMVPNYLYVTNGAQKTISSLTVKVRGQDLVFLDVAPGDTVRGRFIAIGDSIFNLSGNFSDGTPIEGLGPYFSNGEFGLRAYFRVTSDGNVEVVDMQH